MKHWQLIHSPLVYWTRDIVLKTLRHEGNNADQLLDDSISKDYVYGIPFKYGLPQREVEKVCRKMYQNDMVKLTLQINVPKTTKMHKQHKTTFGEQLGVVGKMPQ